MTEDMYFCIMHKLKWYKGLVMDLRWTCVLDSLDLYLHYHSMVMKPGV